jgi:alpha-beta hydrolase superfamily lysophospholipase
MSTEKTLVDSFGVTLFMDYYPAKNPRGVVLLLHGIGEHAGRYAHVAAALTSGGFATYIPDQRGSGRTGMKQFGDVTKLGRLGAGGFSAAVNDILELTHMIRAEHPRLPIFLLGHSMGSLMGQIAANAHASEYAGLIWSGSASRTPSRMNAGDLNKKFAAPGATGHEWLSRDPKVWADFAADPWCFDAKVLALYGVADGLKLYGRPAKNMAQTPILMFLGSDDSVGGEKSVLFLAEDYIKRSGQNDVTVTVYPEGRHEMFNETNKEQVIDDLLSWLTERTKD